MVSLEALAKSGSDLDFYKSIDIKEAVYLAKYINGASKLIAQD